MQLQRYTAPKLSQKSVFIHGGIHQNYPLLTEDKRTTEVIQFSTLQSAISTLLEIWSNH